MQERAILLLKAVRKGQDNEIKLLLDSGADANANVVRD